MRWWRDRRPEYVPRPKAKHLSEKEKEKLLATMTRAVAASPVLSHLGVRVRVLRGRFYIERDLKDQKPAIEFMGRITPLVAAQGILLLEVERRYASWYEVAEGSAQKLIKIIASDTRGKFHGLGSLDKVLRKSGKGLTRLPVKKKGTQFTYIESEEPCTAQDALFHYFGVPMEVIAEPSAWYAYHRVPSIEEANKEKTRILVWFTASSLSGSFGGSCLYALTDGKWGAYTIKPSESESIASAEVWLEKRKWRPWC